MISGGKIYEIIDNFLPQNYFENIFEEIVHSNFPWYFQENITGGDSEKNFLNHGLQHSVLEKNNKVLNEYLNAIFRGYYMKLMEVTGKTNVDRCRIDATLYTKENHIHPPHVDSYKKHITTILYLTDSICETVIYNYICNSEDDFFKSQLIDFKEVIRVKPKQNRLLIFDGSYLHTGHSPTDVKRRILINTNLS